MSDQIIIVADDSNLVKNIIKKFLDNEYTVFEASNGKEVIDIINSNKYDIRGILLDLNMPYYNGYYVLDYFRTNNLVDKIPVAIISGDDTKETINDIFNYKIIDILSKPFTQEQIKNIVNKMVDLK